MNFLAPLFLLGAFAAALPVVFHLIRRSSREQMPFSSLMFLRPAPPRVTKRSRIEHLLLLLLRCLVIGLLALGFARPYLQKPLLANAAGQANRKIILLLDTSASMRREGLWAAALAKANEALKQTTAGDQAAIFTFDSRAHSLVSFEQWAAMNPGERAALAAGKLADVKPGWAGTHLGNALTAAAEAFTEADKQGLSPGLRRIVLITDLQEGSRLDGLQGYDWPRGVEVEVETVQPKRPTNAGLQWVLESEESARSGVDAGPRIRVSNSANAQHEQFQLRWDGVAGALPLDIYVPPGQNRIVQTPQLPAGAVGEKLALIGDDDDFDNSVYVLQPKAEQINVLFLGQDADGDTTQPLYYLKHAFQQTRHQAVEIKVHRDSIPPAPAELAETRLMIATDPLPDGQAGTAQGFLTNGGTVLLVMKSAGAAEIAGQLAGLAGVEAQEVTPANYALFGFIDFQNPLFAPFADARYNDFTKIHFWKHRRLDAGKFPNARVLARFDDGDAALLEIPVGPGRLLVLTSGWQPADSQLALSSKFVPLLYSILDLSGALHAPPAQFHIGEPVNLADLAGNRATALTVRKPDGSSVTVAAGETKFSQTDLPGIYTLTAGGAPYRFAVNLDAAESRTAPLPGDQLERLGVPMKTVELASSNQLAQKRRLHDTELEGQQKLWRWLTLAAIVVLLGETLLAGWVTRRAGVKAEVAT